MAQAIRTWQARRNIDPLHYTDGTTGSDNIEWDAGETCDVTRWSGQCDTILKGDCGHAATGSGWLGPIQDTPGYEAHGRFRRVGPPPAASTWPSAMARSLPSATRLIPTHHRLGNIADGLPIDAKAF